MNDNVTNPGPGGETPLDTRRWPEDYTPHDPRARAARDWYGPAFGADLAQLPAGELRPLLAEAITHVRLLLDAEYEADMAEDADLAETHVTMWGDAVIRGEDVLTVNEALEIAAGVSGDADHVAKFRALASRLQVTP
jgi:hypothetical protein